MRLLKIGRDVRCDIVIQDKSVSSLHAEIVMLDSGDMTIEDKNSTNGTYVMNQRIKSGTQVNIKRGDKIVFGEVELNWSQVPQPEDNSAYKGIYGVGSHFSNYIQVTGATVSRYHATIKHGKDGRFYIVDHSKNGTTLDGIKLQKDVPYRIKRKSVVVCGGAAVDLSRLPWPSNSGKTILTIAAGIVILLGLSWGIWKLLLVQVKRSDQYIYNQYDKSVVMVGGLFHYEIQIGGWSEETMKEYNDFVTVACAIRGIEGDRTIPGRVSNDGHVDPKGEFDQIYYATAFFVSDDGILATNLHAVKPWMFGDGKQLLEEIESHYNQIYSENYEIIKDFDLKGLSGQLITNIGKVKVVGVLDVLYICPNNQIFDIENMGRCTVIMEGEDTNVDVALIQTITREIPHGCKKVNIADSMDVGEKALEVGQHVYTLGFPGGKGYQMAVDPGEKPIRIFAQGGSISQGETEYLFGFNAPSLGGASGSPIFNEYGKLIGILNSGFEVQGYNYGVKAKYLKQFMENYEQKNK